MATHTCEVSGVTFDTKDNHELLLEMYKHLSSRLAILLRRMDELEKKNELKPHKCPVCDGSGKNYNSERIMYDKDTVGFYGKREDCASCDGTGIVWG